MTQPEALRLVDVPFALREGLWHTQADHVLLNLHVDNKQLRAQRDALLKALKAMLTHMGMDEDEWNKPTFDQARAAIKAVEAPTFSPATLTSPRGSLGEEV